MFSSYAVSLRIVCVSALKIQARTALNQSGQCRGSPSGWSVSKFTNFQLFGSTTELNTDQCMFGVLDGSIRTEICRHCWSHHTHVRILELLHVESTVWHSGLIAGDISLVLRSCLDLMQTKHHSQLEHLGALQVSSTSTIYYQCSGSLTRWLSPMAVSFLGKSKLSASLSVHNTALYPVYKNITALL